MNAKVDTDLCRRLFKVTKNVRDSKVSLGLESQLSKPAVVTLHDIGVFFANNFFASTAVGRAFYTLLASQEDD